MSQNILAACNFEMEFTYVLAGWEGSAHDGTVYRDAHYNQGFTTPPGKYWLGDAGYSNTDNVVYHRAGHITEPDTFLYFTTYQLQHAFS